MKKQYEQAVKDTTEARALLLLIYVLYLRARRAIPSLRPIHLLFPATISQLTVFFIALANIEKFLYIFAIGNLLVVSIVLFPSTIQRTPKAHWVRA